MSSASTRSWARSRASRMSLALAERRPAEQPATEFSPVEKAARLRGFRGKGARAVRWWWILVLACAACSRPPAPEAEVETPPPVARMVRDLGEAGLEPRAERLRSLREFPGCPEARFRFRLHFRGGFVNVSRFDTPEQASACLAD